jgi:hypothetical protein
MAEIDDLKTRVALLEREASELRGMVHALVIASQTIVDQAPLMVASRTAKTFGAIRHVRVQGGNAYQKGFRAVAGRLGGFGKHLHSILAPEVAEWDAKYAPKEPGS